MKAQGDRITMVTAYDAPSARLAEAAGIESILVGDSVATTMLGLESTVGVTVEDMLVFARAVSRSVARPLVVVDMPFGSFQPSDEVAVRQAVRLVKDGGAHAVKIEGGGPSTLRASAIVEAGIPVMGHVGLTPQSAVKLGGYRPQGRTPAEAQRIANDAVALERAGCFAIVLEAVPADVAAAITIQLTVPTIGIGAGPACDGQVLVWHDLLGLTEGHVPRFVKAFGALGPAARAALEAYVADVRSGTFPEARHTYGALEPDGP